MQEILGLDTRKNCLPGKVVRQQLFFFFLIIDSCHFGERTNDFLRDSLKAQPPKEKKSSVEVSYIYGSMARYR